MKKMNQMALIKRKCFFLPSYGSRSSWLAKTFSDELPCHSINENLKPYTRTNWAKTVGTLEGAQKGHFRDGKDRKQIQNVGIRIKSKVNLWVF